MATTTASDHDNAPFFSTCTSTLEPTDRSVCRPLSCVSSSSRRLNCRLPTPSLQSPRVSKLVREEAESSASLSASCRATRGMACADDVSAAARDASHLVGDMHMHMHMHMHTHTHMDMGMDMDMDMGMAMDMHWHWQGGARTIWEHCFT
eukprot:1627702-Prymnesium_polylepis.1